MSSEMIGGGAIAAILLAPAALAAGAAFGAGWVAWQAGKLAISAADSINEEARIRQLQAKEQERQKHDAALAAHRQMVDMCKGVLTQLESTQTKDLAELEAMGRELRRICQEPVPADTVRIESLNARGLLALERVVARQGKLRQLQLDGCEEYAGRALSDLMDDLRLSVATVQVSETRGDNVAAADPRALERAELNKRLAAVSARVLDALNYVVSLERNYGLSRANHAWFGSCFIGVDDTIRHLCAPSTPNEELKQGIRALEDTMKLYDRFHPTLRKEQLTMDALYPIYQEAAAKLCEQVMPMYHFCSSGALQAELNRLALRAKRAEECAAIYQALGAEGYMCYAWDQELLAMGYSVCSREKITQMVTQAPARARIDGKKMPFYEWTEEAVTQIYEITPECRLQLIVHPDGTTTMETIAAPVDDETIRAIQKVHCQRMKLIRQRLRENWFILHDLEETDTPETVHSVQAWQDPAKNPWVASDLAGEEIPGTAGTGAATPHQREMQME